MDVYFSSGAYTNLKAFALAATSINSDGLLFGHRRGQAFFVEHILSTSKGFFSSRKKNSLLQDLFHHNLIGFFTSFPEEKKTKSFLVPSSCGKIYIEARTDKANRLDIKPFLIDYENGFSLTPLRLKKPTVKG